jgi:hypothetical protein
VPPDTDMTGYNLTDKCSLDIALSLRWRLGIDCSNLQFRHMIVRMIHIHFLPI